MTFTPLFMPQRSSEWYQARLGRLTGSCADAILAERKRGTGELKARADLRRRLVCERLTGLSGEDAFETEAMRRGRDLEPLAFAAYEARTRRIVQRVGFVQHASLMAGCSPDGYVAGPDGRWVGLIELKVPKSTTHLAYIQGGVCPEEYVGQCQHALWLTGADWIDFCSFDDRFDKALELFIVRVERNEAQIADYDGKVRQFLSELDAEVAALQARIQQGAAA